MLDPVVGGGNKRRNSVLLDKVAFFHIVGLCDIFVFLLEQIEEELLGKIRCVIEGSLTEEDSFDLSRQMGVLVELMQTHSRYAAVLLSDRGDPSFTRRLKELIWPLLNRFFVPSQGHSPYEMGLLAEFYLSGILAAVSKWSEDPQLSIDQFIAFMLPNIFPAEEA